MRRNVSYYIESLKKTPMVYSVSYFYLGGLGILFGGLSPPVAMGLQQGCREIFTALKLCHHVKKFGNHWSKAKLLLGFD